MNEFINLAIPQYTSSSISRNFKQPEREKGSGKKVDLWLYSIPKALLKNFKSYYMASSLSWQDESNPALWLPATRAGKMELSCPLGTTRRFLQEKFPRKPYNKFFIDQACSVKMARCWPRSFFASLWTSTPSRFINTQQQQQKKKKLGQHPVILTSHLVNNLYIANKYLSANRLRIKKYPQL